MNTRSTSPPSKSTPGDDCDIDFDCPVCQDVLQTPVRVGACKHVFCRMCFIKSMKNGVFCPLCRGTVGRKEKSQPKRATEIEEQMKTINANCKGCDKKVKLSTMRRHSKLCKAYQKEYSSDPIVSKVLICEETAGCSTWGANLGSTGESSSSAPSPEDERPQPTYKCPMCPEVILNRKQLLEHCNKKHCCEITRVVCPICEATPWGTSNRPISDFVDHLNEMHKFDYSKFMDFELDEETQLQTAVEQSFASFL